MIFADKVTVRSCANTPEDREAMWVMLTYAARMEPAGFEAIAAAKADPTVSPHLDAWGRHGDLGVLANEHSGEVLGAAWVRLRTTTDEAHIVATTTEPELAIGVHPHGRGRGIGRMLMLGLFDRAKGVFPAIVLSVREENPAVRLYARLGFETVREVVNRVGGRSFVMRYAL